MADFIPNKEFLYFIADKDNMTCFVFNDNVLKDSDLHPLPNNPDGWKDIVVEYGLNQKYFGLQRSFTVPLTLVKDAAKIARHYYFTGKGFEEEYYLIILRWNRDTGIYELEYKGRLDLKTYKDFPQRGVQVNSVEGGLLSYFNSNEGTAYEIACDETNHDAIMVCFDGINLRDKLNYINPEFEATVFIGLYTYTLLPVTYISNEGDNVNVSFISQQYEFESLANGTAIDNFFKASENVIFESFSPNPINITISGIITFEVISGDPNENIDCNFVIRKSDVNSSTEISLGVINVVGQVGNVYSFDFSITTTVNYEQKIAIAQWHGPEIISPNDILYKETSISIEFDSRNGTTTAYALQPYQMLKQIVSKMTDGRYTADSVYMQTHNDVVITCGDAIRNTSRSIVSNYYISLSFSDFVSMLDFDPAFKIINNVLYIEPKTDVFGAATNNIFDLGEVAALSLETASDMLCNTLKTGYPDQEYNQRSGKYEFNQTRIWNLPISDIKEELDISCKGRGDGFGAEFIRGVYQNKDTTDNSGDKQPFVIKINTGSPVNNTSVLSNILGHVSTGVGFSFVIHTNFALTDDFYYRPGGIEFVYQGLTKKEFILSIGFNFTAADVTTCMMEMQVNGTQVRMTIVNTDGVSWNLSETVLLVPGDVVRFKATKYGGATSFNINGVYSTFQQVLTEYNLSRPAYTSITGVLDNTVFNTEISPARQILKHGSYIRSLFYQQPSDKIIFSTGTKNIDLETDLSGVVMSEKKDITIGDLAAPFFIPMYVVFTTKVPYAFAKTMAQMNKGEIKITYNNNDIYCLPIGSMKSTPATGTAQEWKLLLSANNSLATLMSLSDEGLFFSNSTTMIFISKICPVHFVKYNYTNPPKYNHVEYMNDWAHNRNGRFAVQPYYFQKWQTSDSINLQVITSGLGQLTVVIYNEQGYEYSTTLMIIVANTAVQAPYSLQQLNIPLNTFPEGKYQIVIKANGIPVVISEWQDVRVSHPETYLYEYTNSFNKLYAYFNTWGTSAIRCESLFLPIDPESDYESYEDEPGNIEALSGTGTLKRRLLLGGPQGFPEFMAFKMNEILMLDGLMIEGVKYTRPQDAKMESNFRQGVPFNFYSTEMKFAKNDNGLTLTDTGGTANSGTLSYTLDAEAFGQAPGTIDIDIQN